MTHAAEMDTSLHLPTQAGDHDAFQRLTDPYRRELLVHCYRILGSLEDAEDVLQETLLRAWRRLDSFEGRAPLRAWLYKIATNASLDALDSRSRRFMPATTHAPANPGDPFPSHPGKEFLWLEPLPDTLIDERLTFNPEARFEARESVTLAFLVALQHLPGRQRAVLILRDVLAWRASETAKLLDTTVPAVNSALERARKTMKQHGFDRGTTRETPISDAQIASLLNRYVAAWEAGDSKALVAILHEDAVMTMPPLPLWYHGRDAIRWFLDSHLFSNRSAGQFRLVPTQANGSPAFAIYHLQEGGEYRLEAVQVLTIEGDRISTIDDFIGQDEHSFRHFDLTLYLTD